MDKKAIKLKHPKSGIVREVPIGFSWTSLFFGPFVPIFRGDALWAIAAILLTGLTGSIFHFIFPFIYNKIHLRELLYKGYEPAEAESKNHLKSIKLWN